MGSTSYIKAYVIEPGKLTVTKFEIVVKYFNGDRIDGSFGEKVKAIRFLRDYCR